MSKLAYVNLRVASDQVRQTKMKIKLINKKMKIKQMFCFEKKIDFFDFEFL